MSMPTWWGDGARRRRQNRRSAQQERLHARRTGGKVQPGSGSSPRARGDVRGAEFLDELKYTDKLSFPLRWSTWDVHKTRALELGREPRMIVEFMFEGRPVTRLVITEEPVGRHT